MVGRKEEIMVRGKTAHNRTVYASPLVAARGSVRLGRFATRPASLGNIPTAHYTYVLPALVAFLRKRCQRIRRRKALMW